MSTIKSGTYTFKDTLTKLTPYTEQSINFTANNQACSKITIDSTDDVGPGVYFTMPSLGAYEVYSYKASNLGWLHAEYKTIIVNSDQTVTDAFYAWFNANIITTVKLSVDLTTLSGWSSLADGLHQITIKAKADGYRDSAASSAVSVTKSSGVTLEAGTYLINATPAVYSGSEQAISGKTYYLTANNTYSTSTIDVDSVWSLDNILHIKYSSQQVIAAPNNTGYNHTTNSWYSNNMDGDTYTATDTAKLRTIILETDQTVSQEFYDWFMANATKQSTGETWVLNSTLSISSSAATSYDATFTSNNTEYKSMALLQGDMFYVNTEDLPQEAYTTINGWSNTAYRTITFSTAPTGDLLTWLQANGTKQGGVTTKKFGIYNDYGNILNKEYDFEEGQTWEQWISSSYNTDGFVINGSQIRESATGSHSGWRLYDYTNDNTVSKSETISETVHYGFTNETD